ncbi:Serine/threonine-protein kinase Nek3, partial [Sciurus carolinensis]|nr:Serine/threonine-protein kinase Nek3 [Sciurus carolinensis]
SGAQLWLPSMDDYAVLRVIGEGSFGRALLVQQESSNQMFAMKEIRLPKILNWFTQMCLGVNHIHKKRVLHRDIKSKFQANSWKSLILKICQGSVHPLPSHYSYELQYLVKQMFKRNPSQRPSATTLLSRSSLARLVQKCLPAEIITEYGEQILDETKMCKHNMPRKNDPSRMMKALGNEMSMMQEEEKDRKCNHPNFENTNTNLGESALRSRGKKESSNLSVHSMKASSPSPQRRQWEKNVSSTALKALENAPILTSSLTAEDDRGGSIIKYSENNTRKQWLRETPDTLLNILNNAELSLAFQTYTIYRPGSEGFLKGPLSDEAEVSDSVDGHSSVTLDPERLEPRLDEEDTYVVIHLRGLHWGCVRVCVSVCMDADTILYHDFRFSRNLSHYFPSYINIYILTPFIWDV